METFLPDLLVCLLFPPVVTLAHPPVSGGAVAVCDPPRLLHSSHRYGLLSRRSQERAIGNTGIGSVHSCKKEWVNETPQMYSSSVWNRALARVCCHVISIITNVSPPNWEKKTSQLLGWRDETQCRHNGNETLRTKCPSVREMKGVPMRVWDFGSHCEKV